jgi:hypothetical protein
MINRDIYLKDPESRELLNKGTANVNDEITDQAMDVLRFELDTFVCDGQYEKGLVRILETYTQNINKPQQPAVWVSGFFGSGKSHLVKMLRALWLDTKFKDGATARGIANLSQNVRDLLKELSIVAKKHDQLHAISGTLGSGSSDSLRLALLRLVFKSKGLPERYGPACFAMWLMKQGIFNEVKGIVEEAHSEWFYELENLYASEAIHNALVQVKPNLFPSTEQCVQSLNNMFPHVGDISNDEMVKAIRDALTSDGIFPLTLIVLDEVQQFISEDGEKARDVQEVVEACCKNIGGKLIFVGTGQTAITGTSNLKKLEGRFTLRIELSDTDVDTVIRKVILQKKPDTNKELDQIIQNNIGEISRHLANSSIGHRRDDMDDFVKDYPILPVRRRFWEYALRALDQTGTESQVRNQLTMVLKAVQDNLDKKVGHVIPADYLYFDAAYKLLQSGVLSRQLYEKTITLVNGNEKERLTARACAIVFLVNKLAGKKNDIGIKATVDTVADLLVEDISKGSGSLRSQLPGLMDDFDLLMKVDDEYRIQTKESSAWDDEFRQQMGEISHETHLIETERDDRIRRKFKEAGGKLAITHGETKNKREIFPIFENQLPANHDKKITAWIRDGWNCEERSVLADARQAGNQSATIFIFLPRRDADKLRHYLIEYKAATNTLSARGVTNNEEASEALRAMETRKQAAEGKIHLLLDELFSGARVFQGGGNEILGNNLQEMIKEAAENAAKRLYPKFAVADQPGWDKVLSNAQKGAPDALKAIHYDGETKDNPVCKEILAFMGSGKKGAEIRRYFEDPPCGWPRDTVDGALQVLLISGLILATNDRHQPVEPKMIDRKQLGKVWLKIESTTVSTKQKIQVRSLLLKLGVTAKPKEELTAIPSFIDKLQLLANRAGGDEPKPAPPDQRFIDDIQQMSGNELILALFNRCDEISQAIDSWTTRAEKIAKRWPSWLSLMELFYLAGDLEETQDVARQVQAIKTERMLLSEPDPVQPLLKTLEEITRNELNRRVDAYTNKYNNHMQEIEAEPSWQELTKDERDNIINQSNITPVPEVNVGTRDQLMQSLRQSSIKWLRDQTDALSNRFENVRVLVAKAQEPQTRPIDIPRRILKTETEIDTWLNEVEQQLKSALKKGPLVIR